MGNRHGKEVLQARQARSQAQAPGQQPGLLMARTHGIDKRKQEQAMKSSKHDGGSSITESSHSPSGSVGKPYKSGANVSKGSKPAPGSGGVSVAAGPKDGKKGR